MLYGFLVLSFFAVRRSEKRFYVLGNKKGAESSAPVKKTKLYQVQPNSPLLTPR